ncbi:MAG: hypothetical protein ACLRIT_07900 [Blautia sp.]
MDLVVPILRIDGFYDGVVTAFSVLSKIEGSLKMSDKNIYYMKIACGD